MAQKLSITIALEGGKAIEQQLEGIGEAGKKAFEDISAAAEKAGGFKNLKPEEVTAKLKELGVVGKEALDKITGAVANATRLESVVGVVQGVEKGFAGLAAAAGTITRALGPIAAIAAATATALVKMASDAAAEISKIDQSAIKAGMSIGEFDRLRQGFEAAGLSAKQVASAMSAIGAAADKAKLDQIGKDLKFLQDAAKQGIVLPRVDQAAGVGAEQMQRLVEAAKGVGPAVEPAKTALAELGVTLAPNVTKSLSEMIGKFGDTGAGVAAFVEQLRKMPDSANRSALAIDAFKDAGAALVQSLRDGSITEDQFKQRLGALTPAATEASNKLEESANKMATAWDRLKTTGDLSQLGTIMKEFGTQAGAAFSLLTQAASQAFSAVSSSFDSVKTKISEFVSSIGGDIWSAFSSAGTAAINAISSAIDGLIVKVNALIEKLAEAIKNANAAQPGGGADAGTGSIPGNARGGLLGGRGTGTSDSNLAWVSRGEHIMPARAVAQPGVLALLEALRRSGGNLRGVLDGMGRFAAGGVVPRFAAGGMVGGMGHLGTVDLRTDHGSVTLMASGSAVEQLTRLAVTKRMTSTGRKPGFIG